jgi:hypothetical protein
MQTYNQVAMPVGKLWDNTLCGIGVSEEDVVTGMLMATDTELPDAVIVSGGHNGLVAPGIWPGRG